MTDYYTDDDEDLIELQAELTDIEIEVNGQDFIESLMYGGFDR